MAARTLVTQQLTADLGDDLRKLVFRLLEVGQLALVLQDSFLFGHPSAEAPGWLSRPNLDCACQQVVTRGGVAGDPRGDGRDVDSDVLIQLLGERGPRGSSSLTGVREKRPGGRSAAPAF